MEKALEKYFIEDGKLKPVIRFYDFLNKKGTYIFEVIRVISGVPLFVDEHLDRLQKSAEKSGKGRNIDLSEIKKSITFLIKENQTAIGNIKIVFRIDHFDLKSWIYFIPFIYPSEENYFNGVELGILNIERINPEAKTIQPEVRETANKMISSENFYEVLLVDKNGLIREGSRSNVFFIKGEKVITPPKELILNGITRQKVIDIINPECCEFEETSVHFNQLKEFDCVFITGTSPKVLPVNKIEDYRFDIKNSLCKEIIHRYNQLINNYISERIII